MTDLLREARILIIDDEPDEARDWAAAFPAGFETTFAENPESGLEAIAENAPDVVLLDLDMQGDPLAGFGVLERIGTFADRPETIMFTVNTQAPTIVRAIKQGAFHYVCKPPLVEDLLNVVRLALGKRAREREIRSLRGDLARAKGGIRVARDPVMLQLLEDLDRVAPTDVTVLITGESGTGKEMIAKRLHAASRRADGPCISVNCAALTPQLVGSEIFGHEKGAFTGADARRESKFELASGGTLFLDEIGEVGPEVQGALLRVLEDGTYRRIGGNRELRSSARVVAATSRDLQAEVDAGRFMSALYHRLNAFHISVPPLRDRPGDIEPLARSFLHRYRHEFGREVEDFTPEALQALRTFGFAGNVRELKHMIINAVILSRSRLLGVGDLFSAGSDRPAGLKYDEAKSAAMLAFKRKYLISLMRLAKGNVTRSAEISALPRASLQRMLRETSVDPRQFRKD